MTISSLIGGRTEGQSVDSGTSDDIACETLPYQLLRMDVSSIYSVCATQDISEYVSLDKEARQRKKLWKEPWK